MFALLKKDLRLNAVPIVGGALLVATPYVVVIVAALTMKSRPGDIPRDFQVAVVMGTVLAIAVAAIFGGAAFALERREHWADFLALLPVTRHKILLSKLIVGVSFLIVLWLGNFLACRITGDRLAPSNRFVFPSEVIFAHAAILMCFSFAIAWFLSSFLRSPAIAACTAIGIVLAAIFIPVAFSLLLVPALAAFVAGSLYYLQRIEP